MAGDKDDEEPAYIIHCRDCGAIDVTVLSDLDWARRVAWHFVQMHGRTGAIAEGRDFWLTPAVPTCDLCGVPAEKPWWEHKVDDPNCLAPDIITNDGRFLVCQSCHEDVIHRRVAPLIKRNFARQKIDSPGLMERLGFELRFAVAHRIHRLLPHLDEGRREEL